MGTTSTTSATRDESKQTRSTRVITDRAFALLFSARYREMYLTAADGRANVPNTCDRSRMKDRRAKTPSSACVNKRARTIKYTAPISAAAKP